MNKEELEKNLDRVHEWIRAGDQKASIWLAFQGIILAYLLPVVFGAAPAYVLTLGNKSVVLAILWLSLSIYSIAKAILSVIPTTKNNGKHLSLLYFGAIAMHKMNEYKHAIKNCNEKEYKEDLIEQIYHSSLIASKKYEHFWDSVYLFFFAYCLLFIGAIYKYLIALLCR